MVQPNTYWRGNKTSTDVAPTGTGDANWHAFVTGTGASAHTLVFTGSGVANGAAVGTRDDTIIPSTGSVLVAQALAEVPAGTMTKIPLLGAGVGQRGRYALGIYFDGATQSSPYLEAWDDANHTTTNKQSLGAGTPGNSYLYGFVTTTVAPPASDWTVDAAAKRMAGGLDANRLQLNATALSAAAWVFCNLAVKIPSTATPFNDSLVLTLRYTYN